MIYKEKEKNSFEQRLKRYPVEQQIKIKKRRKIVLFFVLCLSVLFAMFYPSIALFGYNDAKEYIKHNFISRTELEEAEIYLNPSCDFFASKSKELKGTDTDIYEIHFSIGQINSPVKAWIYGDNERLLNELYIDIPQDIHSALYKVHFGSPTIYVFENEIHIDYWNEQYGGYQLCRSLNNFPPTEKCKYGLYFYVKDGWWNFKHWNTLWNVLF